MPLVVQDGFPGQGAATNLLNVDADKHALAVQRPAAFSSRGVYRATLTSPTIASPGANTVLWLLAPVFPTNPQRLVLVNSVTAACAVGSTITTAVQMDLGLFLLRGSALIPGVGGGTSFAPIPLNQQLRTSMGGSVGTIAICGTANNLAGTVDTNAIGRVMGFSGTAVGTQFFSPSVATLYQRDAEDNHPIVLTTNTSQSADLLVIKNVQAGPATGNFTITVTVEWEELLAY
jgi:hypothetical protein